MGLVDWLIREPAAPVGIAGDYANPEARGRITLAAQRIEPGVRPDRRVAARNAARSGEQWNAYDSIGEIGYVVDLFANAMRRVRVFPAGVDDPEQGRVPLDECQWATPQLIADAIAALDRVRSIEHGQGEILGEMARNLKVAGKGHLYARVDPVLQAEDWMVLSTDALQFQHRQWVIKQTPEDRKPTPIDPGVDPIWTFWQRHPRWPGLAYSEMARVLGHAENLQILERAARNRARSRAAGAGILVTSNRYKLNGRRNPNGPKGADVFDDLMTAGTAAIQDEAAVSAFMPIMADFDVDDARKVMHHVTLDRPLSEIEEKREDKLLRRIAQGLDAPPELITGMADLNHWTAWQVESSTYEAHIEPLALRIADTLAIVVVRAALLKLGHPAEVVARVLVGVDPSDLVRRPNKIQDSKDAHKALVISDATHREDLGYTDEDAPKMDELLRRMALQRGVTSDMLTAELLANYAGADVTQAIANAEGSSSEGPGPTESQRTEDDVVEGPPDTAPPALAAAARRGVDALGGRLQAIDDDLFARVAGAAEVAIAHALQRATSRAANRARGTGLAATIRDGGRGLVHRLGDDGLAQLRLSASDLATEDDFESLEDQWGTWVAAAYAASSNEITTATGQPVDVDPDTDIAAGWAVLIVGLLAATRTALTQDPDVASVTDGTVGEGDPTATVQPGLIRQALSRAGGARGQVTDGGTILMDAGARPAGGVATGEQILAAAGEAGLQLVGHTWRVGAPATPFPPHHSLNGVTFATLDDPGLTNETGHWPGNARWYVGDHAGCRCTAEPIFEPISPN